VHFALVEINKRYFICYCPYSPLIFLIYCSTMCHINPWIPISARYFLVHLKPTSSHILIILKTMALYTYMTCLMEVMILFDIFSLEFPHPTMPKCMSHEVVITNGVLLIAITSIASVTLPCLSSVVNGKLDMFSRTHCGFTFNVASIFPSENASTVDWLSSRIQLVGIPDFSCMLHITTP